MRLCVRVSRIRTSACPHVRKLFESMAGSVLPSRGRPRDSGATSGPCL
ncbi:hypothetical protein STXM2123_5161 [Streptomyces sp. F-3]|nr:hypothetical protein STXM2123_5161 [Streptomyces sp. F-3]